MKKLFVVTDIHGHCTLLKAALEKAGYDRRDPEHLLICCGDYFDRGEENREVLQFFERQPRAVLLRGNHEDLLLELLRTGKVLPHNYINGTMQTLEDFFGKYFIDPVDDSIDFSGKTRTVDRLCEFIDGTVDYFETENYVFVHGWHAGQTPQQRAAATRESWVAARWIKWNEEYVGLPPIPGKTLVCGHMPTFCAKAYDHGRQMDCADIFYGNGLIALDAGTYTSKQVNVLVLEDELLK